MRFRCVRLCMYVRFRGRSGDLRFRCYQSNRSGRRGESNSTTECCVRCGCQGENRHNHLCIFCVRSCLFGQSSALVRFGMPPQICETWEMNGRSIWRLDFIEGFPSTIHAAATAYFKSMQDHESAKKYHDWDSSKTAEYHHPHPKR